VIQVRQRADLWSGIGAPKSGAGRREIPMSPLVVNALKEWRLSCPKGALNLVFPTRAGGVLPHNTASYSLLALEKALGMIGPDGKPRYGLHSLRHFFASWAIEQGFSPKRVQVLLGHSSIQMTFDIYGHLFPNLADDHARFAAGELTVVGRR
jgi:integrase